MTDKEPTMILTKNFIYKWDNKQKLEVFTLEGELIHTQKKVFKSKVDIVIKMFDVMGVYKNVH